ncbi:hypothetical protein US8_01145 [Bacillus altitudinis]|nr:hypothetical protein US8_01145 [Bacillus altitudinis]
MYAKHAPKLTEVVVFPTPPFWLVIAMIFPTMSPTFNLTSFSFIHTSYSIKKSMKRLLFLFPYYKFVNESVFPYMNRCIKMRSKDILIYFFKENNETKKPHFYEK